MIFYIYIKKDKLLIFITETVFLFDENRKLISVPGAAGASGNHWSNGSLTTELQHADRFRETHTEYLGYGD